MILSFIRRIAVVIAFAILLYALDMRLAGLKVRGAEPGDVITSVSITVPSPKTGEVPATSISQWEYTGAIQWTPNDNPFEESKEYSVVITLTARNDFVFGGYVSASINGRSAETVYNGGSLLVIKTTFAMTEAFKPGYGEVDYSALIAMLSEWRGETAAYQSGAELNQEVMIFITGTVAGAIMGMSFVNRFNLGV